MGVLAAGSFLSEACLRGQPHAATATVSKSSIERLEKWTVLRLLGENLAFSELFVEHLLSRNLRMEDMVYQILNSHEKRLARAFLTLAGFGKEGRPKSVSQGTLLSRKRSWPYKTGCMVQGILFHTCSEEKPVDNSEYCGIYPDSQRQGQYDILDECPKPISWLHFAPHLHRSDIAAACSPLRLSARPFLAKDYDRILSQKLA
jgi:hypothetical protein